MAAPVDPSFAPLLLALPSFTPSLALEVLPAGLTIHRLFVQADAKTHDILIGPEDPAGHRTQRYTNTIIGRYANRLPVGSFPISRNGLSATVTPLSNESDTVSLHGGRRGFDDYTWEPLADPSAAELFTKAEVDTIQARVPSSAVFTRVSEDGEEGFPGRLRVEVLVGLLQPEGAPTLTQKEWNLGSVLLVYRAKLLDPGKVTPINLTQHWGFNLDASLQESLSVQDHKISIAADNTIALTPEKLSAGSLAPVAGTAHAHAEKPDGRIGAHAYDEFYLFSRREGSTPSPTRVPESEFTHTLDLVQAALEEREEVVRLEGARSGLRVGFATNQSGVQFYTNNFSAPEKTARKKIHGGSGAVGDGYGPGTAAFLEFHEPLAAWLHPATRGAAGSDTLLASGEIYNNFVRADVWFRSPDTPRPAE